MNEEKRLLRRQRLMDNKAYQTMEGLTRYMDRYYLDALIGVIPGWGDAIALLCVVPFVYFSSRVIKSLPLTLAVLNNALRDVLLGMIPFFVGDIRARLRSLSSTSWRISVSVTCPTASAKQNGNRRTPEPDRRRIRVRPTSASRC